MEGLNLKFGNGAKEALIYRLVWN